MLKIENYNKLKYKVVGKLGWHVDSITEQMLYDPITFKTSHEKYHITLSNRAYAELVVLDRKAINDNALKNVYKLQNGHNILYIDNSDLKDMDKFCDCLARVINK